jgi:hypothetical protein
MINGPSEHLFAFEEAFTIKLYTKMHPNAFFLFNKLSRLFVNTVDFDDDERKSYNSDEEDCNNNDDDDFNKRMKLIRAKILHKQFISKTNSVLSNTIKTFEFSAENQLQFVKIEMSGKFCEVNLPHEIRKRVKSLKLGGENSESLDRFLKKSENTEWSQLTELNVNGSALTELDPMLFTLYPKLEKLELYHPKIYRFDQEVFKFASNLQELVLYSPNYANLEQENFLFLKNLRVLKLGRETTIHSFEKLCCLTYLEELDATIYEQSKRVKKFVHLPHLKKLVLRLKNVEWVDAKAFDHLTSLERFDVFFEDELETFSIKLALCFLKVRGVNLLRLNNPDIEEIDLSDHMSMFNDRNRTKIIEPSLHLNGLKKLSYWPIASYFSFHQMTHLEVLNLEINDLSILNSGQLKCLRSLKDLKLIDKSSIIIFSLI